VTTEISEFDGDSSNNILDESLVEESILNANVSDLPTDIDSLGFGPYVRAVVDFLINPLTQPPLTISVEGEWGSGKSSFMLQVERELRNREKGLRAGRLLPLRKSRILAATRRIRILRRLRRLAIRAEIIRHRNLVKALRSLRVFAVRFNAWRHDREDAVWAAFALECIRKLSGQLPLSRRLIARIKLQTRRFKWWDGWFDLLRAFVIFGVFGCVTWTAVVLFQNQDEWVKKLSDEKEWQGIIQRIILSGGIAGYLVFFALLFIKLKGVLGNPLAINLEKHVTSPDYDKHLAFIEQFHNDFSKIVETYVGTGRVYVFIDDLDRCDVPKAAELMQAVNLLISDAPQLVFIIGMDREKVAAGLAVKYEKLLPYLASSTGSARGNGPFDPLVGLEYGYTFIEKFIQLPFIIPQLADQVLQRAFLNKINASKSKAARPTFLARVRRTFRRSDVRSMNAIGNQQVGTKLSSQYSDVTNTAEQMIGLQSESSVSPTSKPVTAAQKRRRELIRLRIAEDSQAFQNIVLLVAPALDNNPRRIKQFINLFRLRAFIANETGLFDLVEGSPILERLTFEKLGKFVALGLKWPMLLAELDVDRILLANVQDPALVTKFSPGMTEAVRYWNDRKDLRAFLRSGFVDLLDSQGQNDALKMGRREAIYSLAKMDLNMLLQVQPQVTRTRFPDQDRRIDQTAVHRPTARPVTKPFTDEEALEALRDYSDVRSDGRDVIDDATNTVDNATNTVDNATNTVDNATNANNNAIDPSAILTASFPANTDAFDESASTHSDRSPDPHDRAFGFDYHVFLAHRLEDVSKAEIIANQLKENGISPWFVAWNLAPGRKFGDYTIPISESTGALAVLIDRAGIGPWNQEEFIAVIEHFVEHGKPVIPMLLSHSITETDVPQFLKEFGRVEFNGLYDQSALDKLMWGITGRPPKRDQAR